MLPHTTSAVSAFPEDDVGRPTQFVSKTGVGTTGLFLCSNDRWFISGSSPPEGEPAKASHGALFFCVVLV